MKKRLPIKSFTNIRVLPSGFQVTITRAKIEFSKHFAGHSPKSRAAALKYRDELLGELPQKRLNPIPRRLLTALKLKQPVVGVFRHAKKEYFLVSYRDSKKRMRSRAFSWRHDSDAKAYATAIAFRNSTLRSR